MFLIHALLTNYLGNSYESGFYSCGLNSTCFCKLIAEGVSVNISDEEQNVYMFGVSKFMTIIRML